MTDSIDWQRMREQAPFSPAAFQFVHDGLGHTVRSMAQPAGADGPDVVGLPGLADEPDPAIRHVTGQELCLGLRSYAVERYGLLARTVLLGWGVRSTEDFGKIVYAMVDAGLMRTSEGDSVDDFRGVYDFAEAFEGPADAYADGHPSGPGAGAGEVG